MMKHSAIVTIVVSGIILGSNVSAGERGGLPSDLVESRSIECAQSTSIKVAGIICDTIEKFCETCPTSIYKSKCEDMYEEYCGNKSE